jgi:ABC-2 type transport system ATP-binding protein
MDYHRVINGAIMIEVLHLRKQFKVYERKESLRDSISSFFFPKWKWVHALEDVSFHINPGEIIGYIGPNGAGKSTTLKIMSGILLPTSGTCKVMGMVPWKNRIEYVRQIGVVFGQRSQLWWDVPVLDSFLLLKEIYRIKEKNYKKSLAMLVDILQLQDLLSKPVRQLSLGQRIKCEIAASLLHQPSILFLDEPTIGLDAVAKIAIRKFIQRINHENRVTVILTTHDMHDIEALTNRVILIGKGRTLFDGNVSLLKENYTTDQSIEEIIAQVYTEYEI